GRRRRAPRGSCGRRRVSGCACRPLPCSSCFLLEAVEQLAEVVEALLEYASVVGDPGGLLLQAVRSQRADPRPAFLAGRHEPGGLEDGHVLLGAGQRDARLLGELADRGLAAPEPLEEPDARGV